MSDLLESELEVQRAQPGVRIRRHGLNGLAFCAQPCEAEGAFGSAGEAGPAWTVVDGRCVDVEYPALAPVGRPLDGQVLDGLLEVVGSDVDVAGVAGAAHGDVGEFSAAPVGEDVSAVNGCPLHAVDRYGVGVVEAVTGELFAGKDFGTAVVEADGQPVSVDHRHRAKLAGHEAAVVRRCEREDAVAAGVALASWRFDLEAFDRPDGEPALAGALIEGGDVAAAPGEQARFRARLVGRLPRRRSLRRGPRDGWVP